MIENGTRIARYGMPVVVVEKLQKNWCVGCVHLHRSSSWCEDETARVFGASKYNLYACSDHDQMFIHDTPEAWAEYLKARLAGGSTGQATTP